jgi:DNA invertase Pin-like site-specific DNA recombinase
LLKDAVRRRFDLVAVSAIDRLGRSLTDLLSILGDLHGANVDLYVKEQGLDTTSPSGRAAFSLMGIFAELERNLIRERVLAGLARARAEGRKLGRPTLSQQKTDAVVVALKEGSRSLRAIAKEHRVGLSSVHRLKNRLDQEGPGLEMPSNRASIGLSP